MGAGRQRDPASTSGSPCRCAACICCIQLAYLQESKAHACILKASDIKKVQLASAKIQRVLKRRWRLHLRICTSRSNRRPPKLHPRSPAFVSLRRLGWCRSKPRGRGRPRLRHEANTKPLIETNEQGPKTTPGIRLCQANSELREAKRGVCPLSRCQGMPESKKGSCVCVYEETRKHKV